MTQKKKTLADIIEEELKKFDAKPDLFADDPVVGQAYDEAQNKGKQKINKPTKKKTITGAEIIDLLLSRTEPAPLLETIPRWRKYLRECITGWVHIEDLIVLKGDVDDDFNNCVFRTNDLYYCIREMGILDEMREEKLVVDEKLETLIQESSKPEPTQPEPEAPPEIQETRKEPTNDIFSSANDWKDISFLVSNKGITLKSKKIQETFKVKEFEAVMPDKKAREFLLMVIHTKGVFNSGDMDGPAKQHLKSYVSHLRTSLKKLFGISSEPIKSLGDGSYQTMFSVSSEFTVPQDDESLDPESNTPPEIGRQIKSSPPDDLLQ